MSPNLRKSPHVRNQALSNATTSEEGLESIDAQEWVETLPQEPGGCFLGGSNRILPADSEGPKVPSLDLKNHFNARVCKVKLANIVRHPNYCTRRLQVGVAEIAAGMKNNGFYGCGEVIVRPTSKDGVFEALRGNRCVDAARLNGLEEIVVYVIDCSDIEAIGLLVCYNKQMTLSALALGEMALDVAPDNALGVKVAGKMSRKEFCEMASIDPGNDCRYRHGATVYRYIKADLESTSNCNVTTIDEKCEQMARIFHAPKEHWLTLTKDCLKDGWSIRKTEKNVRAFMKSLAQPSQDIATAIAETIAPIPCESTPAALKVPENNQHRTGSRQPGDTVVPASQDSTVLLESLRRAATDLQHAKAADILSDAALLGVYRELSAQLQAIAVEMDNLAGTQISVE